MAAIGTQCQVRPRGAPAVIGLDTNVVVRYLVADDPKQAAAAARAIRASCTAQSPGFINLIVLCELVWVLESSYGYPRSLVAGAMDALCQTPQLRIERADLVKQALDVFRDARVDLADCLVAIVNHAESCSKTITFDNAAATLPGFEALV